MKHLIAFIAIALFAAAPLLAQDGEVIETEDGQKVRIVKKNGATIIKPVEEECEDIEIEEVEGSVEIDGELPEELRDILKRVREDLEKAGQDGSQVPEFEDLQEQMRKRMEEMRKRIDELRKEMENGQLPEEGENVEVEEYESEDGSVKIKIVRIVKTSSSSSEGKSESEAPKKETERKQ